MSQEYNAPLSKGKVNKNFCLRAELGWNRSWFTSLGASYVYSNVNGHTPLSIVTYVSAEANLRSYAPRTPFYAYKAGIELGGLLFALGAELRNNTDFTGSNHMVFTPKAGLSIYGHANLFYGYNVFRAANNIFGISYSQLSLNVNLNRKVLKEPIVPAR